MNPALRAILVFLLNRRYIGGKHTPEKILIKRKTQWVKEKNEFKKEYKQIINEGFVLRCRKRTGKGSDWHISLNPRKLQGLIERIDQDGNRRFL
jgi:hypothetical protein